jgi:uncharacterized coiled-coil protein SlyX
MNWIKENWLKFSVLLGIFLIAWTIAYNLTLKPQPRVGSTTILESQLTGVINLQDLVNSLASSNLNYLTLALALILGIGGAFYIFNIKPFENKLDIQEKAQEKLKDEIDEKINTITKLEEKLNAHEGRLSVVENNNIDQILANIWTQHLVAQSTHNFGGNILALTWYLELTQLFKRGDVKMCLEQIEWALDNDDGVSSGSTIKMKDWNSNILIERFSSITASFKTIIDPQLDDLKINILKKATQKWF